MPHEQRAPAFMNISRELGKTLNLITDINTRVYPGTPFRHPLKGISTGFVDIDITISGLNPGLTILAARPSLYLPDFVHNVLLHTVLEKNTKVLYASLTPARETIIERMLFSDARVNVRNAYEGYLSERDHIRLEKSKNSLKKLENLLWIPESISNFQSFQDICVNLKRERNLNFVIIDNFQELVRRDTPVKNRNEKAEEIAERLENLSHSLQLPFVLISEVDVACDKLTRRKSPLIITDLKDCSALHHRARPALLFYRTFYEEGEEWEEVQDAFPVRVAIENNRYAPQHSMVNLTYLPSYGRFESAAKIDSDPLSDDEKGKYDIEIGEADVHLKI